MNYSKGLAGVVVDETAISNVEGEIGRLTYRGYSIEELVEQDYLSVMWLVLFGELPSDTQLEKLNHFLQANGVLDTRERLLLSALGTNLHSMQMLQAMIPALTLTTESFEGLSNEASRGLVIIAKMPGVIAGYHRLQQGLSVDSSGVDAGELLSLSSGLDASNVNYLSSFLTEFTGEQPSVDQLNVLKVVQILQMEHSFNAGTFSSMCVSSTLAPIEAVIAAGVGALAGVLHGGADEAAMNDAIRVGNPDKAVEFIEDLLARQGKLMGMGHREYRVVDPRSVILKPIAKACCLGTEQENLYLTLEAMEVAFNAAMKRKGKEVWANLEFYKGAAYQAVGIPADYFTAVFAMSRAVGWLAHFIETRHDNRIFRPRAEYTGPAYRKIADS